MPHTDVPAHLPLRNLHFQQCCRQCYCSHMWRSIDWCYVIGYALSTLLATILVATRPFLYPISSLLSDTLYVLPWTIAIQYVTVYVQIMASRAGAESLHSKPDNGWFYCQLTLPTVRSP